MSRFEFLWKEEGARNRLAAVDSQGKQTTAGGRRAANNLFGGGLQCECCGKKKKRFRVILPRSSLFSRGSGSATKGMESLCPIPIGWNENSVQIGTALAAVVHARTAKKRSHVIFGYFLLLAVLAKIEIK